MSLKQRRVGDQAARRDAQSTSRQFASSGASRGAATILKSRAPALVRMIKAVAVVHHVVEEARPPRRDQPGARSGASRSTTCVSEASWPCTEMSAKRPSRVGSMAMNQAGSFSTKISTSSLCVVPSRCSITRQRTMVFVLLDIEERLANRGSRRCRRSHSRRGRRDRRPHSRSRTAMVRSLGAEVVGAPGEFRMVRRMAGGGEVEERLALSPRVAVDQHRLVAPRAAYGNRCDAGRPWRKRE